jgi:hypothetical protein
MGESSFGKGFGQIDKLFGSLVMTNEDKEWAKIPSAIFDGLANRYRFVFIKRALRRMGWGLQFDWPKVRPKTTPLTIIHSGTTANPLLFV